MILWSIAAAAAGAALQPGSQTEQDVHCLAAFAITGDALKDEKQKRGLMLLTMYYVGRIDGEAPGLDLEQAIRSVVSLPDYATKILPDDLRRCGMEMQNKGADLQAVGKALQAPRQ